MGLIVNTRPAFYHDRFHTAFGELPWAIYDCPVTMGEPIAARIPGAAAFDTVIFTSQLGVESFAPGPEWLGKQVFAVGSGTAEAAYAAGFKKVMDNFQAESAKLVQVARTAKDVDAVRSQFSALSKSCAGCHDNYRTK